MEDLPVGLSDDELAAGLARFGITGTPAYAPVGFGDYHWNVEDRWFTSVSDLAHKPLDGLRRAMNTAVSLSEQLPFVVAPLRAGDDIVVVLNDRYALTVFPFLHGKAGSFGDEQPAAVAELLAALHGCTPPEDAPEAPIDPPGRAALEALLDEPGEWFDTTAREVFVAHEEAVRALLAKFDDLAAQLPATRVLTHGEPHPGNLIRTTNGLRLIDWDTVGLAAPERDLSLLDDHTAYRNLTGHQPNAAGLALYRTRWTLDDIAQFATKLRAPHEKSRDAELTSHYFKGTLAEL
ncbi:phosphotransferase [Lentzea sp. NPDC051838]|uniref:phosphotransferase n=1 Tax=Lentzea sp. NPDC051838 TaxID=3154849 RepID=UPI003428A417